MLHRRAGHVDSRTGPAVFYRPRDLVLAAIAADPQARTDR